MGAAHQHGRPPRLGAVYRALQARHVFIIAFAMLVLFFLYQQGDSIAADFRRLLARRIGEQAEHLLDVALRALRASVNSMLVVGLFDGILIGIVYAVAGAPHAVLWAAITGSLAVAPLVGYWCWQC